MITRSSSAGQPLSGGERRHRRRLGPDGAPHEKVCEQLASEGISIELIDPRTVAPLDIETIRQSVAKTGRLLIVDETFAPYGIGAEIAAQLADQGFDDLDARFAGSTVRLLRPL